MKNTNTILRLNGSLILFLLLYAATPWINENTSNDFTSLEMPIAIFGVFVATFICINLVMIDGSPDGKLLHTAQGKRELLWHLADKGAVERKGWPWWAKAVVVWLGYRGAVVYAIALAWLGMRNDQGIPFVLVVFAVPALIASIVFLVARLGFERWGEAHPETVDSLLNTSKVQDVLEQHPQAV